MAKKVTVCFAAILVLSPIFTGLTFAQVDPEKALIGKWADQTGSVRFVINSVKATGSGEWIGYGSTDGGNIEISISKKDNEIYLEWITVRNRARWSVNMTGDDKMEGTIGGFQTAHSMGGTPGRAVPPRRITLEKVKARDVK